MPRNHFETQIHEWLTQEEIRAHVENGNSLLSIAFKKMIRWHPQVSMIDHADIYGLSFWRKINEWRMTNRAIESFRREINGLRNPILGDLNRALRNSTHPEHNIPVSLMSQRIINLRTPTINDVRNLLNTNYEVLLISQHEKSVLNGNPNRMYQLDGAEVHGAGLGQGGEAQERLDAIHALVDEDARAKLVNDLQQRFPQFCPNMV
jgi:hypothetical protein